MGLKRLSLLAVLWAGALALAPLPASAQQQALSPSQAAFLKAENRRIEDYFVLQVSRIVGIQPEQVRRAMPDERRITVAVSRLISALEMVLGHRLTDEQTAAIVAADEERRAALIRVREGAALR